MDEAAHAAGISPVAFRLRLLDSAGRDVHPDGALAQVEGAALWGAGLTLPTRQNVVIGHPRADERQPKFLRPI
jgi:hypothetical protein